MAKVEIGVEEVEKTVKVEEEVFILKMNREEAQVVRDVLGSLYYENPAFPVFGALSDAGLSRVYQTVNLDGWNIETIYLERGGSK